MDREIIGYCNYCKAPIFDNQEYRELEDGRLFHYSEKDPSANCYFPEEVDFDEE